MSDNTGVKPEILVGHSNTTTQGDEVYYSEADFVLINGLTVQLWVDGVHFIEDPNGSVREGQYFIVRDPGLGVMISVVEAVDSDRSTVTVRHVYHWQQGELEFVDATENWEIAEITGDFDRTLSDASSSIFVRKES